MENENYSPEERARMGAELLKLKLIAEHGAHIHMAEDSLLSAEMELAWLQHITHFERLSKEAGYAKVYDFIGQPGYKKATELKQGDFETELDQLLSYMYERGVCLHFNEDEEAETIYRFVTEELFEETMNCYRGPGGEGHAMFDYYSFHPDHVDDVTRYAFEYLDPLFKEPAWKGEFLKYTHSDRVSVDGIELNLDAYSEKMASFKKVYPLEDFVKWEMEPVSVNLENETAFVNGKLTLHSSVFPFKIFFKLEYSLWCICGVDLELIG